MNSFQRKLHSRWVVSLKVMKDLPIWEEIILDTIWTIGIHINVAGCGNMSCPKCKSEDVVRIGKFNPDDDSDIFKCLDCEHEFGG